MWILNGPSCRRPGQDDVQRKSKIELVILGVLVAAALYWYINSSQVDTIVSELSGYTAPAAASPYVPLYQQAASDNNVPFPLLVEQGRAESDFNPSARSGAGALGIAQFLPSTAATFGINPLDPTQAIPAQAEYMAQLYQRISAAGYGPSWALALAAYNWGINNVLNALNQGWSYSDFPQETRNYVYNITNNSGVDTTIGAQFA